MTKQATTVEGEQLVGVGQGRVRIVFVDGHVEHVKPSSDVRRRCSHRRAAIGLKRRGEAANLASEDLVSRLEAAAAVLEVAPAASEQPESPTWLTHEEVCERLRVHPETVKAAMLRSERRGLEAPWVNVGSEARPRYRWQAAEVDAWWADVQGSEQVKSGRKATRKRPRTAKGRGKVISLRDRLRAELDSAASDGEA